ncbi:hypothetical protein C6P40_002158 [Pichia californica]|uniref:Symplekin/Pta1 N-terminal domain-containing protein n=1 Tax=Pichia californica TaxID=460514 RepID=A0A9P7BE71_9ASCO|nr:hypothetical protein C6P40_002158 [[Candida] californica]
MSFQLKQIQEAAKLAFENNDYFVQILDTIIAISLAQPLSNTKLQSNCVSFIYKSFVQRKIKSFHLRADNSLKLVDMLLKFIINDEVTINIEKINYNLIQKAIEIFSSTYNFMFLQLIKNPDNQIWSKISHLKEFLISKWPSSFPLLPLNKDTDLTRSIGCKIALAKLLAKIIQTQLPYPPNSNTNTIFDMIDDTMDISISLVNKDHPFLYTSSLNTQGQMLIDYLLNLLNTDSLLPTSLFSTLIALLMTLFKTRPNFTSNKTLNFILAYESQFKNSSKFESNKLKIRLNRRFNDRIDRVLMSMLLNRGFIDKDAPLKTRFGNKLSYMVEKSNQQKKRGILSEENDTNENNESDDLNPRAKRIKLDNSINIDYFDESIIAKSETFKSIYTLINPKDELANFDISAIPSEFINNIVILGLSKIDSNKLNKGLEIVSSRYMDLYKRLQSREDEKAATLLSNTLSSKNQATIKSENQGDNDEDLYDPTSSSIVKKEEKKKKIIDISDDDFDFESESKKFELPIPRILDPNEKKDQIKLIVDNFIKSSSKSTTDSSKGNNVWLKILSRLATRGTNVNPEIADYIRESLFNYFKEDVKGRIDGVIEWLNEEYYSDFIVAKKDKSEILKSNYMKYSGLVLDYLIPFLEPNDRNIFIRLLSELPYLDLSLLSRLKSICSDPVRSKTGFQPLLYLIMFRPPVFNDCIQFLVDLYKDAVEKNNEHLQTECLGYLKKYKPDLIPSVLSKDESSGSNIVTTTNITGTNPITN